MRAVENDQGLSAGSEVLPLRVGPRHMGNQRAMAPTIRTVEHRQMAGKRRGPIVSDERGEAVELDKRRELAGVLNSKSGRNIHRKIRE